MFYLTTHSTHFIYGYMASEPFDPVCGMMHVKEPLLLIGKSSPCGSIGFSLSRYLNGPLPYV